MIVAQKHELDLEALYVSVDEGRKMNWIVIITDADCFQQLAR